MDRFALGDQSGQREVQGLGEPLGAGVELSFKPLKRSLFAVTATAMIAFIAENARV